MIKSSPIIEIHNLIKSYNIGAIKSTVLKGVSLTIQTGEMLAIVGASGSGKSTLMNLIGLLDLADAGEYKLIGQTVNCLSSNELAALRNQTIGFVFQQFNLLPRFNALYNVALPLMYRNISKDQAFKRAHAALKRVGMQDFTLHRPTQLSGGQQQRVAIARAIVGGPKIILADEPTGALDSSTGKVIMRLFESLHNEGCTLIIITHDEDIASLCQRNITLVDGLILHDRVQ